MLWHDVGLRILSNFSEYDLIRDDVFKEDLVALFITWVRPKAEHISKKGLSRLYFDWASKFCG